MFSDQFSDVTSFNMVYTPGHNANKRPVRIWPGTGKPGMVGDMLGMAFFSRMLYSAGITWKAFLQFLITARAFSMYKTSAKPELYWNARRQELSKSDEQLETMYKGPPN